MWQLVGYLAVPLIIGVVGSTVRGRRARRAAGRFGASGDAVVPCLLRGGDAPYPDRFVRGALRSGAGGPPTFELRARRPITSLAGLRLVRSVPVPDDARLPGRRAGESYRTLMCRDANGVRVDLVVASEYVEVAEQIVAPAPGTPPGATPGTAWLLDGRDLPLQPLLARWVIVLLVLVGLGALVAGYGAAFGRQVPATTVTATDADGLCRVAWPDPWTGQPRTTEVDCADGPAGRTMTIIALPYPVRGEAVDVRLTSAVVEVVLAVGCLVAGAGVAARAWGRRRARRAVARRSGEPTPHRRSTRPAEAPFTAADLRFDRIAEAVAARAGDEGWADFAGPSPERLAQVTDRPWWRVRTLRRSVTHRPSAAFLLVVLAFVVFVGVSGWWSALATATRPTATAVGTVTWVSTHNHVPYLPYDTEVRFTTRDGRSVRAGVARDGSGHAGDRVDLTYVVGDPQRARVTGDPSLARGAALTAAAALAALAGLLIGLVRAVRRARTLRRLLGAPPVAMRYCLTRTPSDDPVVLLFPAWPADAAPAFTQPLAHRSGGEPAWSGQAEVYAGPRGAAAGRMAVVVAGGRVLWSSSALGGVDDTVLSAVTGQSSGAGDAGGDTRSGVRSRTPARSG